MKKRIGSLLLGIVLVFALASCGMPGKSQEDAASDEIVEIAIENVTLGAEYPDTEKVEEAVNEITIPAINCRVKIVNCNIEEHEDMVRAASAGSVQLDLVNTGLTTSLSELVSDGLVIELDELLVQYGGELPEKKKDLMAATTIDGKIYAVPANQYLGRSGGIGYNASIAEQYGIEMPEEINLQILTDIGEQLAASGSGVYLTTQGDGSLTAFDSFYDIETFGGDLNYGVIFEPSENTTIVNVYESQEYTEYCKVLKTWRESGYMPENSIVSGEEEQVMFNTGRTFFQWSSVSPGTQYLLNKKGLNFDEKLIAITPNRISTSMVQEFAWGISSSCENPEKAMELLAFIYENDEVANLLANGREGVDYVKTSETTIRYADGKDLYSVGYGSYFSSYGDFSQTYHYGTGEESTEEELKAFSEESEKSSAFGYTFQISEVSGEVAAVLEVVSEYRPILETGLADDVDLLLAEFQEALREAGIEEIISENQRQLDLWLAEQ